MRILATVAIASASALLIINAYSGPTASTNSPPTIPAIVAAQAVSVEASAASASTTLPFDDLCLDGCGRLFIDGGSNLGEGVAAFLAGNFYSCALTGPPRIYSSSWPALSKAQRHELMAPLAEPKSFCIRSFEVAPALMPPLQAREATLRGQHFDVRFVHGALSNVTLGRAKHEIVRYSRHPQGESATSLFRFDHIHLAPGGVIKPKQLGEHSAYVPSFDLVELVEGVRRRNASAVLAVRLDIEGGEYAILSALVERPDTLCFLSYLFVEFHHSATPEQRNGLPKYGLAADVFERLKERVHAAIERPQCRLRLYWRSFWASCGDQQRFEWRDSEQATMTSARR